MANPKSRAVGRAPQLESNERRTELLEPREEEWTQRSDTDHPVSNREALPDSAVVRKPLVAVIMGSRSDLDVMKPALAALEDFDVPYHVEIISAHRTPVRVHDFAAAAREVGFKVIIAGAGGAAHLPGMVAANTTVPVVGVPVPTKNLGGQDSLYSIVQMPAGVPVATVSIGGAENAAILAAQILSNSDDDLAQKLIDFKHKLISKVDNMNAELLQELSSDEVQAH